MNAEPPSDRRSGWLRIFDGLLGMVIAALIGLIGVMLVSTHGSPISPASGIGPSIPSATTATTPTTPAVNSPVAASGVWEERSDTGSGLPASGTRYEVDLQAGQLLMLTGGQFQLGSKFCYNEGQPAHICVLIYQATTSDHVTITSLYTAENWVGISDSLSAAQALELQQPIFWTPANCETGCTSGTVFYFNDGQSTGTANIHA